MVGTHLVFQSISPSAKTDFSDKLTIWTIWLLIFGGGLIREMLGQSEIFKFGFYTFHSIDPGIAVSALAVVAHLSRGKIALRPYTFPILIMALLIGTNFIRGVISDQPGSISPLIWLRANAGVATIPLLAICMRPNIKFINVITRALSTISALLCLLIILRLIFGPTLFMTYSTSDALANDGGRPLSAFGTFLLVLTSGLLTSEALRYRRILLSWRNIFVVSLPFFIFATRQGAASIIEIVVIAIIVVFERGRGQWWRVLSILMLAVGAIVIISAVSEALLANDDIMRRSNNLETRQLVWTSITALWPTLPLNVQWFGYAANEIPPIFIYINGSLRPWESSIHSMYYGALPMMGYTGLVAYVALLGVLLAQTLVGTLRQRSNIPSFAFASCAATAIFSFTNEVRGESLLALFLAILWLRAAKSPRSPKLLAHWVSAEQMSELTARAARSAPPARQQQPPVGQKEVKREPEA